MWMAKGPDSACRAMLGLCSVSLHVSNLRHAPTVDGADAVLASRPADSISARGEWLQGWEMLGLCLIGVLWKLKLCSWQGAPSCGSAMLVLVGSFSLEVLPWVGRYRAWHPPFSSQPTPECVGKDIAQPQI